MREAIGRFTFEKDQAPQSLRMQELVNGHYLEQILDDPFTGKKRLGAVAHHTFRNVRASNESGAPLDSPNS